MSPATDHYSKGVLSNGAKAGIGIGAVVGALACIGMGVFIAKAMQWRRRALSEVEGEISEKGTLFPPNDAHLDDPFWIHNANAAQLGGCESKMHEMSGSRETVEISTEERII
jgi:hypothetical protein